MRRSVAAGIDLSILGLTTVILAIVIGIMNQDSYDGDAATATGETLAYLIIFVHPVMTWLYFAAFHSSKFKATFGKQLLGLQVRKLNSQQLSFGNATVRFMCKLLSVITLIGYPMALFAKQGQSLHDMMAETLVTKRS